MRGALEPISANITGWRIIPAYAGSTTDLASLKVSLRDHPRVCGEHGFQKRRKRTVEGSSPRMRGALLRVGGEIAVLGIIPAYAGSTLLPRRVRSNSRDHPRVCGEHAHHEDSEARYPGSSPRMRGAPHGRAGRAGRLGIIPAYAGSTSSHPPPRGHNWDHPRVCGEHGVSSK